MVSACSGDSGADGGDSDQTLETVRIVSFNSGLGNVLSHAIEREGFDVANGFRGEFIRVDPAAATEVFLQGEADVTLQLDMLVSNLARTQGREVTVFAPDFTNNGSIIVREDSDITSPADLVGRRVGHFGLESGTTTIFRVLLGRDYGIVLPRRLQIEFSRVVQEVTDGTGKELTSAEIWDIFRRTYLEAETPYAYVSHQSISEGDARGIVATVK
ncbi:MAG UNVERIFIED_CONTAM: ABC transporter substrate-binding protein, partial [Thermobifida fusca]